MNTEGILYNRLSDDEYNSQKNMYLSENDSFDKSLIFHVGTGAGLYSELGALLECMCFCYSHHIRFSVYSDDANFSNENGWVELFDLLGCEKHDPLNKKANYRYKNYHRAGRIAVPNLLLKRYIYPNVLKKHEHVDYLTQDVFDDFISNEFRNSRISWPLFGIDGIVRDEYAKLSSYALRYNDKTAAEVTRLIEKMNLPEHYASIQIRGGDKTQEFTNIIDADFCERLISNMIKDTNNIFIFTDDYRNVSHIKQNHPEWNIFTLTRPDECGYYNASFNALPWEARKKDLIKLFAIVEICIRSDFHIGCNGACVNNYIRSARLSLKKDYYDYTIGTPRKKTGIDKIKRIFGI